MFIYVIKTQALHLGGMRGKHSAHANEARYDITQANVPDLFVAFFLLALVVWG